MGKLPKKGSKGGMYLMIAYIYDTNTILAETIKKQN